MANLREVRTRISSVKSTRQITSAMKMVSASKLRKAQNAIESFRYYSEHLKEILQDLNKSIPLAKSHKFTEQKEGNKVLVLIHSSNKGLCGPYNTHILKKSTTHINSLIEQNYEVSLYIIGRKANDFFKKKEFEILHFDQETNEKVSFEGAASIAEKVKKHFLEDEFVRVDAVYNKFKNAVIQEPVSEKMLPIQLLEDQADTVVDDKDDFDKEEHLKHTLEPSPEIIVNTLVPRVIDVEFYRVLLDSYASEQGARMTAMHQATENASELIKDLTLTYNKVRQASITRELVEIVSGAEALKEFS